jgi:hypothetical protein
MWIPGLLFEDTKGTEKPSQTPENMGYFREYHKACGRKTGNQLGTLRWCHSPVARACRLRAFASRGQASSSDLCLSELQLACFSWHGDGQLASARPATARSHKPSRARYDLVLNTGLPGDNNMDASKPTLKQKAWRGIKEYFAISLYLWVIFGLFVIYQSVILAQHGIPYAMHGFALINALALAKVMLVAREFNFADNFKDAPLIVPTLFKSAAFAVILGCFKILEAVGVGWYRGRSFSDSITEVGGGTVEGVLVLIALLGVLLIPFFGFTELRRVFGEGKLERLFFTSRHPADVSS